MSTLVYAAIFVITSGGFFANLFNGRPFLKLLAASIAIVSAFYLVVEVSSDVKGFLNRNSAISISDDMLETPESTPVPTSNFDYRVIVGENGVDFIFPKTALDRLHRSVGDDGLASTGFNVDVSDRFSVNCTHWVTQGAGGSSTAGPGYPNLLLNLQCSAWSNDELGSGYLIQGLEVSISLSPDGTEMKMTLANPDIFHHERRTFSQPCVFTIQNSINEFVLKQDVQC